MADLCFSILKSESLSNWKAKVLSNKMSFFQCVLKAIGGVLKTTSVMVADSNKMSHKHTSTQQFSTLVEFLKENSGIAKGVLNAPEYKAKTRELWDGITTVLNSLGPPVKTSDGWKKVWKDFKYHIKDKLRENKKSIHGTGGGPNKTHVFSVLEEEVIALLDLNTQVCGLKVQKFGTAVCVPAREPLKEKNMQLRENLSPETRQLIEKSELLLLGEINEQPQEEEFEEEMEEHAQKTPPRQTRTSVATSKNLLELQVKQQKMYQEKSLQLLVEQNKLLERKNKELKLQTEEMKKIRRLKEQKLKILKRRNEFMENESKENAKLKLRELEIKKKKLDLKEFELKMQPEEDLS